jgi:hypothetical protein
MADWIGFSQCFGVGFAGYLENACSFDADLQDTDYSCTPEACDVCRGRGGWSADVRESYRDA